MRKTIAGSIEPDPDTEEFEKVRRDDLDDYQRDKAANPDKKWPGLLGEPVFRFSDDFLAASSDQQRVDDADRIDYELVRRMNLLAVHFGLDPKKPRTWFDLALHLASEHVPGFMPPKPAKGRPRGFRTGGKARMLAQELTIVMEQRGKGPADAIRYLHKKEPYKGAVAKSFEAACYEVLNRYGK